MNLPLVSVIIPVYNTGELARKLIRIILDSNYENLEIVVVDDGSTDNSVEILQKIKNKKVKIISQKNGGPSAARNRGIKEAMGEYLLFIDSDDDIDKKYISELVREIKKTDTAMVSSGVKFIDQEKKTVKTDFLENFPKKNDEDLKTYTLRSLIHDGRMYPVFNKIFRADIIKENSIKFDEKMKFGEDTKFVLDYLGRTNGEIEYILKPLYIHNLGTSTSMAKKMEGNWNSWRKCYANLKKWVGKPTAKQKILLTIVYLRWRYTWIRSKKLLG